MQRFYCHNGRARASMAVMYDPVTGATVVSLAFANKGDLYTKKEAVIRLNNQLTNYMLDTVKMRQTPTVFHSPNTFLAGMYDGPPNTTKNAIVCKLIDEFGRIGPSRNVDFAREWMHHLASGLIIRANHRLARELRMKEANKPYENLVSEILSMLENAEREAEKLVSMPSIEYPASLDSPLVEEASPVS